MTGLRLPNRALQLAHIDLYRLVMCGQCHLLNFTFVNTALGWLYGDPQQSALARLRCFL